MIVEGIVDVIYTVVNLIMLPISGLAFITDINKLEPILQYIRMALYVIPVVQLMPIIMFFIALMSFRITVSILRTIWDILPLV